MSEQIQRALRGVIFDCCVLAVCGVVAFVVSAFNLRVDEAVRYGFGIFVLLTGLWLALRILHLLSLLQAQGSAR